jgi:hypothetical protein
MVFSDAFVAGSQHNNRSLFMFITLISQVLLFSVHLSKSGVVHAPVSSGFLNTVAVKKKK